MLKCALNSVEEARKEVEKILGKKLSQATEQEKKKAFRRLGAKYHPDKNRGNEEWASKAFKFVQQVREGKAGEEAKKQRSQGSGGSSVNYNSNEWQEAFKQREARDGSTKGLNEAIQGGAVVNAVQGGLNALSASGLAQGTTAANSYANEYSGKGGLIGQGLGAVTGAGLSMYNDRKQGYNKHFSRSARRKIVGANALGAASMGGIVGNIGGGVYGLVKHRKDEKAGKSKYRKDGQRYKGR